MKAHAHTLAQALVLVPVLDLVLVLLPMPVLERRGLRCSRGLLLCGQTPYTSQLKI